MRYCFIALLFICQSAAAQHEDPLISDFLIKWDNSFEFMVAYAEAMPAEHYNFKPTEEQRPFHEQLTHICGNMIWLSTSFLGGEGIDDDEVHNPPTDKEGILKLINRSFDYARSTVSNMSAESLDESVDFFAGPLSKRRILLLMSDHVTHHRGQLAVYLRLKEVTPPRYIGW